MKDFAAIDFETANSNRSSVCSVGIAIVHDGVIIEKIYQLIRPQPNFYSYWNTSIHGLSNKDTAESLCFPEVWEKIAPRVEGLPLVAHNSPFDEGCLKSVHDYYKMQYPTNYKFYCTLRASRRNFPDLPDHKLNTVSTFCGFDLLNHHNPLYDAEACAMIGIMIL